MDTADQERARVLEIIDRAIRNLSGSVAAADRIKVHLLKALRREITC